MTDRERARRDARLGFLYGFRKPPSAPAFAYVRFYGDGLNVEVGLERKGRRPLARCLRLVTVDVARDPDGRFVVTETMLDEDAARTRGERIGANLAKAVATDATYVGD